jgi:hypothetical protein
LHFLELTNDANGRKIIVNVENIVRIQALSNGKADFFLVNGSFTSTETYLSVKAKLKAWNATFFVE